MSTPSWQVYNGVGWVTISDTNTGVIIGSTTYKYPGSPAASTTYKPTVTINNGISVTAIAGPISIDKLVIYGTLQINNSANNNSNFTATFSSSLTTIILDGITAAINFPNNNKVLQLPTGLKYYLNNGAKITPSDCTSDTRQIIIGTTTLATCGGAGTALSFAQVNSNSFSLSSTFNQSAGVCLNKKGTITSTVTNNTGAVTATNYEYKWSVTGPNGYNANSTIASSISTSETSPEFTFNTPGIYTITTEVIKTFVIDGTTYVVSSLTTNTVTVLLDSDGDCIANETDLDDDNDGILDTNECTTSATNEVVGGTFDVANNIVFTTTSGGTSTNDISTWTAAWQGTNLESGDVNFNWKPSTGPFANQTALAIAADRKAMLDNTQNIILKNKTAIKLVYGAPYTFSADMATAALTNASPPIPAGAQWVLLNSTGTIVKILGSYQTRDNYIPGATTLSTTTATTYTVNFISDLPTGSYTLAMTWLESNVTTNQADDIAADNVQLLVPCDTDNDGIPNLLDLDSDGDGCADVIEGGANFVKGASYITNDALNTTVDGNGVPAVPSATPTITGYTQAAGQTLGQAADATKNDCIDNDGDGVADWQDIDHDNDGIVNCTEGAGDIIPDYTTPTTTSTTTSGVTKLTNYVLSNYITINGDKTANMTSTRSTEKAESNKITGDFVFGIVGTNFATEVSEYTFTYSKPVDIILSQANDVTNLNFDKTETYTISTVGGVLTATTPNITYAAGGLNNAPELAIANGNNTNSITFSPTTAEITNVPKSTSQWNIVAKGVTSLTIRWTSQKSTNQRSQLKIAYTCVDRDTDGDGIPDRLDLDSDNDGCPDAVEGGANILAGNLMDASSTLQGGNSGATSGTYNKPILKNICTTCVSTSGANAGLPQISGNNAAGTAYTGYNNSTTPYGQTAGTAYSASSVEAGCLACYNDPATQTTPLVPSKHGITLLKRAGKDNGNWPMLRQSGHTVLESNSKGLVITRMTTVEIQGDATATPAVAAKITNPIVGMMVYDTTAQCLKIYTGSAATEGWKCFNTAGCPD